MSAFFLPAPSQKAVENMARKTGDCDARRREEAGMLQTAGPFTRSGTSCWLVSCPSPGLVRIFLPCALQGSEPLLPCSRDSVNVTQVRQPHTGSQGEFPIDDEQHSTKEQLPDEHLSQAAGQSMHMFLMWCGVSDGLKKAEDTLADKHRRQQGAASKVPSIVLCAHQCR